MTASDYFQSYEDYFWVWEKEDEEEVVAIPHEMTIAYKVFTEQVLEKIHPQGLPPFGSLLLVIIATNPGSVNSLDAVYSIMGRTLRTTDDATLSKAIAFLKLVAEVPEQYKKGDLRVMLIQALFERCHYILSIDDSKEIYTHFRKLGAANVHTAKRMEFQKRIFDTDFRTISLLANKFQRVDDIIEKIAGVPDVAQYKIDFENVPPESEQPAAVDFVDELIHEPKTFTVGSLIRRLWGGLNIPVHSTLPSQQPLGGISDLTNKGDYDKLLVSEFANDDLVFLSRLANNEALYIHREVPPSDERLERIILIDVSLKNWGTPKAIAFALMLAVVKHPKTDIECSVFALGAQRYYPVSVDNIHTIIEALQIVEGSLHAATSLELFLKEHDKEKNKEILFITESSTQKHPALLKVMNEQPQRINYLFLTDADGNVDIYKKQKNSKKHIQHLQLNLEELWKKRPTERVPEKEVSNFAVNYPILIRDVSDTRKLLTSPIIGAFKLSRDQMVWFLANPKELRPKGWEVIYKKLPFKTEICEIGINDKGEFVLLLFHFSLKEVALINLTTGHKHQFDFKQWSSSINQNFVFDAGYFWHVTSSGAWSITPEGIIGEHKSFSSDKFFNRSQELAEISKRHFSIGGGVLKHIKEIFINENHQLVLNSHVLYFFGNGNNQTLKFAHHASRSKLKQATPSGENLFRFDNGSILKVERAGLILLESPDQSIPTIFIPTSLDNALGVATSEEFAGNNYYSKDFTRGLVLLDSGPNKLTIVKYLKEQLNLSLTEAKNLVDSTPSWIALDGKTLEIGHSIKKELEKLNAIAIDKHFGTFQKSIELEQFYKEYIEVFIKKILEHGV